MTLTQTVRRPALARHRANTSFTGSRIEAVLEQVMALASPGLVTLERAGLLDGDASPAYGVARPGAPQEDAVKLTVFLGRHEQAYQIPAFEAICDLMYRRGVAGATALLGVDGTSRGRRQRPGCWAGLRCR